MGDRANAVAGATTVKEAIARFEADEFKRRVAQTEEGVEVPKVVAAQEPKVLLIGMLPPIQKMDKDITTLSACEQLGLSTNAIEKIGPGLKELKQLRVLSLGRNAIRKLEQLDCPQLEQLWISYNFIDKLSGLDKLKNLRVLYMSNNKVASWSEIDRLATQCPELSDVLFENNPIKTMSSDADYRRNLLMRLPKLTKIDGRPVDPAEREDLDKKD